MLKDINLYMLDMDGTIYLGDRLPVYTPFSRTEVYRAAATYLTNNSSRSRDKYDASA